MSNLLVHAAVAVAVAVAVVVAVVVVGHIEQVTLNIHALINVNSPSSPSSSSSLLHQLALPSPSLTEQAFISPRNAQHRSSKIM